MSKTTGIYKNIDAQLLKKEAGDYAGCQIFPFGGNRSEPPLASKIGNYNTECFARK